MYKEGANATLFIHSMLYHAKEYGICKSLDRFIAWIEPTKRIVRFVGLKNYQIQ